MNPWHVAACLAPLLRQELAQLQQASDATAEGRKPVELDRQSVGRLSRMDEMQNQAVVAAIDIQRHCRIGAIAAAMARTDSGDLGSRPIDFNFLA